MEEGNNIGNVTTLGENRVRPQYRELSEVEKVMLAEFKVKASELIDMVNSVIPVNGDNPVEESESLRLKALAMTAIEEGVMWGTKAITK